MTTEEREALAAARDQLPRCRSCGSVATGEADENDEDEEFLRCVGCGLTWTPDLHVLKHAYRVEERFRKAVPGGFADELRRRLRADVEGDAAVARALFRDAGKPIPAWLKRLDPAAVHLEEARIEEARASKRRARPKADKRTRARSKPSRPATLAREPKHHAECSRQVGYMPGDVEVVGRKHPACDREVRITSRKDEQRIDRLIQEVRFVGFEDVTVEPAQPPPPRVTVRANQPFLLGCLRCGGPAVVIPIAPTFEKSVTVCPPCTFVGANAAESAR